MAKKTARAHLSEHIRHLLGGNTTVKLLREVAPEVLDELKPGMKMPMVSELLAEKVVKLALDPNKSNQWAVEMVFDRSEGRVVQGIPLREDGRVTEDKLNEYTTHHLNAIAASFTGGSDGAEEADPPLEETTPGPSGSILDLPSNRVGSTEAATGEPPVAKDATGQSGG